MNILIDIGHPAHVHYFKNVATHFIYEGHKILFTCRNKEVVTELLESNKFNYISLGNPYESIHGKILGVFIFDLKILKISLQFKPDIFLSAGSMYAAHVAFLLNRPHITLEDTFNMEQVRLYLPFSSAVLTGKYEHKSLGKKEISYNGFQELAYLHPNYFTSDPSVRAELGLTQDEKFFIIRFVSWKASHDIRKEGLTMEQKREIVWLLSRYGKVFISSEDSLPTEFEKLKFPLFPDRMHQSLANAFLFVGEGATMASECALLGTISVYINSNEAGSINEQEKYGLIYHFRNNVGLIDKIQELLNSESLEEEGQLRRERILADKIDITAFLIWFVENWPASFKIMKDNPDYQDRFR